MEITECTEQDWIDFGVRSNEWTIFSSPAYLKAFKRKTTYLLCRSGGHALGGAALTEKDAGVGLQPFQAYNGVIFGDLTNLKPYKQIEIRFQVLEAFAAFLFGGFENVGLAHHWGVQDMRPYDWLNYHDRKQGYFQTRISYTSHLNIRPAVLMQNCKGVRLNSLKTAQKHELYSRESSDVQILDSLHALTFERQGLKRSESDAASLKQICSSLLASESGKLFVTYSGDIPASASFFGLDSRRAYYLFGASNPDQRKTESGTKNLMDGFQSLHDTCGIEVVDLVGVNSPQRGGYKLSFGGALVPYFSVTKVPKI